MYDDVYCLPPEGNIHVLTQLICIYIAGSVINIQTGQWTSSMSGIGAGLDSVYEYLLKSAIVFGDSQQLLMFNEIYENMSLFLRRGYVSCPSML